MKKFVRLLFVGLLVLSMIVPVLAADWESDLLENKFDAKPSWYDKATVVKFKDFWTDGATNARAGDDYVYLKKDDKGDFSVEFEVAEDGLYEFGFMLMGWTKSVLRTTNVKVDDAEWAYVAYDYVEENQNIDHYWTGLSIELTAGKHTFTLSLADDFDDSNVKSLYFKNFFFYKAGDLQVQEPPVTPDMVAEGTVDPVTTAPQTLDPASIAVITAVISAAGYALTKKR